MGILTSSGRFFFQFGLAAFILANIYIGLLSIFGIPVHPVMAQMRSIFTLLGFSAMVSTAIYMFSNAVSKVPGIGDVARVYAQSIAQAAAYATYLSVFGGAVSSIATVTLSLLSLLPLPGVITTAISGAIWTYATASMYYYLAAKISGLPED